MKCMHCLTIFHDNEEVFHLGDDADQGWVISRYNCPACNRMNLFLVNVEYQSTGTGRIIKQRMSSFPIRPRGSKRPPCPPEVPEVLAEDYKEACLVLPDSAKASAALSRRCLQNLLRMAARVKPGDLANEIQQVMDSKALPSYLTDGIDAVRQIGNFAAHPIKSKTTDQIVPVEPQEAEWNLDVLESLFDFYYVQPARIAEKRAALNAKLSDAGKPPLK